MTLKHCVLLQQQTVPMIVQREMLVCLAVNEVCQQQRGKIALRVQVHFHRLLLTTMMSTRSMNPQTPKMMILIFLSPAAAVAVVAAAAVVVAAVAAALLSLATGVTWQRELYHSEQA